MRLVDHAAQHALEAVELHARADVLPAVGGQEYAGDLIGLRFGELAPANRGEVARVGQGIPPRATAVGSQLCAAAMLAPFLVFAPLAAAPSPLVLANLLASGILASSIGLILAGTALVTRC